MLSKEENELLTRAGPGTPCGDLLRRYWQPARRSGGWRRRRGLHGGTGMGGGVGGGAGEWRNWMAAAGATEGLRAHVIDYVPVYASPLWSKLRVLV